MFNDRKHDVSVINSLITTTIDSADGYERSAENAQNTGFEQLFSDYARERRQVVSRLQGAVRQMGGEPQDDGSLAAGLHRRFEDLKASFSSDDTKAVIQEVERGEDYIKAKYEAALKDDDLSPEARQVIEQAYQSVRSGHDQMSQLKHSMQAN